jgi:cytochrome c peroxidase
LSGPDTLDEKKYFSGLGIKQPHRLSNKKASVNYFLTPDFKTMKTLFKISKFLVPVALLLVAGYFFVPVPESILPIEPRLEEQNIQPAVEHTIPVIEKNEALPKPTRAAKKNPNLTNEVQAKQEMKADLFANVTSELELGQVLFWDPILSGNKDVACATCHHPDFAYADSRDLSIGTLGVGLGPDRMQTTVPPVRRNANTIVNTAFNGLNDGRRRGRGQDNTNDNSAVTFQTVNQAQAPMFWDSRIRSLELQALEPIKAYDEMRGDVFTDTTALDSVVARIKGISEYIHLFKKVYGEETTINASLIGASIARFERSLVAVNSPFDRYVAGNKEALTEQQLRGREKFRDVGCTNCHQGTMFSDYQLHALGVPENTKLDTTDNGAGRFRFRTPTLRNVALTAPYMHNGMFKTLEDVLQFYNNGRSENPNVIAGAGGRGRRGNGQGGQGFTQGGNNNNNNQAILDNQFRRVDDMSASDMSDIVAFLNALTDEDFNHTIPTVVPSGLTPGGAISARTTTGKSVEVLK